MNDHEALRDACEAWQDGRDGGSTPIRAAARRITKVPHYFSADWMTKVEDEAEADSLTMDRAEVLMKAVVADPPLDAAEWRDRAGLDEAFAGRGLLAKPEDPQIQAALRNGLLFMPLWGVSLSEPVARDYGEQWLITVEGPFHGIPAWKHSGVKGHEFEVIAGGIYEVLGAPDIPDPPTVVRIREVGKLWPPPRHPPSTWSIEVPFDAAEYLSRPSPTYLDDEAD